MSQDHRRNDRKVIHEKQENTRKYIYFVYTSYAKS